MTRAHDRPTTGTLIMVERTRLGMSRRELARLIGASRVTVWRIERGGGRGLSVGRLRQIAGALGVAPEKLL